MRLASCSSLCACFTDAPATVCLQPVRASGRNQGKRPRYSEAGMSGHDSAGSSDGGSSGQGADGVSNSSEDVPLRQLPRRTASDAGTQRNSAAPAE